MQGLPEQGVKLLESRESDLLDGAGMDVLTDPFTWAIALGPSLYWPIAVALSAAGNSFGAIWNVPAGVRAIARAPLEYALIAGSERVVVGVPPFNVVIGNAQHVKLSYNDQPVDLMPHVKVEVARLTLR
jgi:hypothetical protein